MNGCKLKTNTGFSEQGKSQKTETSKMDFLNQRDHGPIPQAKTTKLQLCWKAFPQGRDVMRKSCPISWADPSDDSYDKNWEVKRPYIKLTVHPCK